MTLPRGHFATLPTCLRFLETTATTWKRRPRRSKPVIGEVLTAIAAAAGRAFDPHVGQRRHLFWHLRRR